MANKFAKHLNRNFTNKTTLLFSIKFLLSILLISIFISFNHLKAQNIIDTIEIAPDTGNGIEPVAIAIHPEINRIYIANRTSSNISVIDTSIHKVVDTIKNMEGEDIWPMCFPSNLTVNESTNFIYVLADACRTRDVIDTGNISIVDGSNNIVSGTIDSNGLVGSAFGINATTNIIYASSFDGLRVIDGFTNEITDTIDIHVANSLVINSQKNRIYVTTSSGLNVIDGFSGEIINFNPVVGDAIAVNPETDILYVSSAEGINVINDLNNEIINNIDITGKAISINTTTNQIYVVSNNEIVIIDGATNEIVDKIDLDAESIAIDSANNNIYVISNGKVTAIDGSTNTVITASIPRL